MHCHTNASDGALSPQQLLALAEENSVELLAITDHDTISGYLAARSMLSELQAPPMLISGVEISANWQKRSVHIVGLGFNAESELLHTLLQRQEQRRSDRLCLIVERLQKRGIDGLEPLLEQSGIVGRVHIAEKLVELAVVGTIQEAFKRYLGDGKPCAVQTDWPQMSEVVDVISKAGGVSVLAHPLKYKLTWTKLRLLLAAFSETGGDAAELISGKQNPSDTKVLARELSKSALLASQGSDFHKPGLHWQALGRASQMPVGCEPVWPLLIDRA